MSNATSSSNRKRPREQPKKELCVGDTVQFFVPGMGCALEWVREGKVIYIGTGPQPSVMTTAGPLLRCKYSNKDFTFKGEGKPKGWQVQTHNSD